MSKITHSATSVSTSGKIFKKYVRNRNVRNQVPAVRVLKGYIYFNRILMEAIATERVDLFVSEQGTEVLIRPGDDFKLCVGPSGRGVFAASLFIREHHLADGNYVAKATRDGFIISPNVGEQQLE